MRLKKLLKECRKHNICAQEKLYDTYSTVLYGICLKYSRNKQEAEDNLQESFIKIFEKIHQFKNKGSFEGWLKRITMNTALQNYRKQQLFEIIDEEKIETPEITEAPECEFSLNFLLNLVQNLPDRYRMVFNLYVLDGYSHAEIAEILNISEGTSKSNLARARKRLQSDLKESQKYKNLRSV